MLPNFICPGTAKAGTTTLFEILNQHPEIYLPKVKETFFFWNDDYYKGKKWYKEQYYKNVGNEKIIVDITPLDMYFEYVPQRIKQTLGENIKIIFILRNPADRAFSHHSMSLRQGFETKSFEEALSLEGNRLKGSIEDQRYFSYSDRGFYGKQIKSFLKIFKRENMYFITFEEFVKNPEKVVKDVFLFLGVEHNIKINYNIHTNKGYNYKYSILNSFFIKNKKYVDQLVKITPLFLKKQISKLIKEKDIKKLKIKNSTKRMLLKKHLKDIILTERLTGLNLEEWKQF